jgi:hypothetical protein
MRLRLRKPSVRRNGDIRWDVTLFTTQNSYGPKYQPPLTSIVAPDT